MGVLNGKKRGVGEVGEEKPGLIGKMKKNNREIERKRKNGETGDVS